MAFLLLSLFLSGLAEELWDTGTALWLAAQGNPLLLGVQHAIGWGASVLAPFAGYLLDRVDRKRAHLFALLLRGGAVGISALALGALGPGAFLALYLLGRALGLFAAGRVLVPRLVSRDRLEWAHGLVSSAFLLAGFLGSGLGGLLFAREWTYPLLAASGAFLLAALPFLGLPGPVRPEGRAKEGLFAGLAFLLEAPLLRKVLLLVGLGDLLRVMAYALLPLLALKAYGPEGFGLLSGVFGLGGALGGLLAARLAPLGPGRALALLFGLDALAFGGLLGLPPFGLALGLALLPGVSAVAGTVLELSLRQRLAPDALLGRLGGAVALVSGLFGLLGALLAGGLGRAMGVEGVYGASALGFLLLSLSGPRLLSRG